MSRVIIRTNGKVEDFNIDSLDIETVREKDNTDVFPFITFFPDSVDFANLSQAPAREFVLFPPYH